MSWNVWRNEAGWPNDGLGYVFLARAVHEIGRAMHGAAWTREEPTTTLESELPPYGWADADQEAQAVAALIEENPNYTATALPVDIDQPQDNPALGLAGFSEMYVQPLGLAALVPGPPSLSRLARPPTRYQVSNDDWLLAAEIIAERNRVLLPALQRLADVRHFVASHAVDGELSTAIRPREGGQITLLDPFIWNTEPARYNHRFQYCAMHIDHPFKPAPKDYLFVKRTDLDRLLSRGQVAAEKPAIEVSELKIAKGQGQMTKGIAEAVESLWPEGMPTGLTIKARNALITQWLRDNGKATPADADKPDCRTYRRFFNSR